MAEIVAPAHPVSIAIVGNPNTGKSTVFNALTGSSQRVANYPGVTVERRSGRFVLPGATEPVELLDLPGSYSLRAVSIDERVAADCIIGRIPGEEKPDLLLYVMDATNLKRNFYLLSQLTETDIPIVIALTMTDLLKAEGVELDVVALSRELRIPVVPVLARQEETVLALKEEIARALDEKEKYRGIAFDGYPSKLANELARLQAALVQYHPLSAFEAANLIFFPDDPLHHEYRHHPPAQKEIEQARARIADNGFGHAEQINNARYQWAGQILATAEKRKARGGASLTARIDRILTHRVYGFATFVGVMYLVFQSIYTWAAPLMDGIEFIFGSLGGWIGSLLEGTPTLASLLSDGVIGGVGSVVVFLPQIIILFTFIALLEASGYLARASFLMDRLLGWSGLNGRAFIPMLSSFACAIPGVMSARVLPDAKARLTTILISPLMSCSARLPVYLLLISAFIEPLYGAAWAAFTLFAMHALGIFVALPMAWILNKGFLRARSIPFVLEMPPYRRPHFRNVSIRVFQAARKFMVRAGTVIFAMSVIIWALSYFPRPDSLRAQVEAEYATKLSATNLTTEQRNTLEEERERIIAGTYLEQSFLGRMGKAAQPIFAPLGYDWKMTVGILGAFPAREVIIATLGIIYNVGDSVDEESASLKKKMADERRANGTPAYTPLVAFSLMIFFALCAQCMSTIVTVQRELNSWKWAGFLFFYMTTLAYLFSLGVYQVGIALGFS